MGHGLGKRRKGKGWDSGNPFSLGERNQCNSSLGLSFLLPTVTQHGGLRVLLRKDDEAEREMDGRKGEPFTGRQLAPVKAATIDWRQSQARGNTAQTTGPVAKGGAGMYLRCLSAKTELLSTKFKLPLHSWTRNHDSSSKTNKNS